MARGHGRGGMSCRMKLIRFIIVTFNILFFIIGAVLLALGIYVMVDPKFQKLKKLLPISSDPNIQQGMSYIEMIAISVIVLGSILLVLGFLGCCGAMKQVRCMLTLYSFIIGAIILAEVALTIYFVAFQSNFKDQFVPKLQQSISQNYAGPPIMGNKPGVVSLAWDFIMFNLQCCGAQNGTDFVNTPKWNKTNPWAPYQNLSYPLTCCPIQNAPKDWNTLSEDTLKQAETCAVDGLNIYKDGCYNKLIELIGSYKLYVIIGAVIVLVIELLAFIFAIALCCRTSKEQLYYNS